ncbi:MAG: phosphoadenosine phosphosulfate reductase family protein, partial [Pseudomonadota bacterium]
MTETLDDLESRSIYIIREAYAKLDPMAMLWSIGKDSTAMLWLVKKAFFGRVPFPLVLLDTGMEMDEVYAFRDKLVNDWDLPIINHPCPPQEDMDATLPPATRAAMRKTEGLKTLLKEKQYKGIICGIRRD